MRRKLDQYYTPDKAVKGLLENLEFSIEGVILEPCNGEGAISSCLRGMGKVITNDVDKGNSSDYHMDMCVGENWELLPEVDWVITNPPFNKAPEIIRNSLKKAKKGTIALLRLTFLEPCKNRIDILTENPPSQIMVTRRISFTGKGCDNVTTAWLVWTEREVKQAIKMIV